MGADSGEASENAERVQSTEHDDINEQLAFQQERISERAGDIDRKDTDEAPG